MFWNGAFLPVIPQAILCLSLMSNALVQTYTNHAKPLHEVNEISGNHHIYDILDNLVQKYNFDKNIVFLSGFGEDKEMGNFSYQTQFEDYLFLSKKQ